MRAFREPVNFCMAYSRDFESLLCAKLSFIREKLIHGGFKLRLPMETLSYLLCALTYMGFFAHITLYGICCAHYSIWDLLRTLPYMVLAMSLDVTAAAWCLNFKDGVATAQRDGGSFSTFFLTKADNEYYLINKKAKTDESKTTLFPPWFFAALLLFTIATIHVFTLCTSDIVLFYFHVVLHFNWDIVRLSKINCSEG